MSSAKWRPFCLGLNVLTSIVDDIKQGRPFNITWRAPTHKEYREGYDLDTRRTPIIINL